MSVLYACLWSWKNMCIPWFWGIFWFSKADLPTCSNENGYPPSDISLKLTMVKRKSGCPDPKLQRQLRGQLRLLENDSKEVMTVFSVSQLLGNCFIYSDYSPCATEMVCKIFGSYFHLHAGSLILSDQFSVVQKHLGTL